MSTKVTRRCVNLGYMPIGQASRIRERIRDLSYTQQDVADAVGVSRVSVAKWCRSDEIRIAGDNLHALAEVLEVTADWILFGGQPSDPEVSAEYQQTDLLQNKFDDTYSTLNRVRGAALAGGGGAYAWEFEEVDHSHAFRREWLDEKGLRPHRCKLWGVTGDSMAPWACDGDVVMINMDQTQIRNGKVYAIAAGDELRIKRLFKRSDGSIEVRSDNPSPMYPTETYYGEDINNIKIIGEVVWRGG